MTFIAAAIISLSTSTVSATTTNNISLQHRYERDERGRITTRTSYVWNGEDWHPTLRWMYTYTAVGYTIEFARYDNRHERFDEPVSRAVYAYTPDQTAAYVTTYTRQDTHSAFQLTDNLLTIYPDKTVLDLIAETH